MTFALGGAMSPPVFAAILKPRVSVGTEVKLGDLFDDIGDKADVTVSAAPEPGRETVFDAPALLRLAQAHQIDWHPASREDRVVVSRAVRVISTLALREALAAALVVRLKAPRVEVDLDRRDVELPVTDPGDRPPTVQILTLEGASGRFSARLEAEDGSGLTLTGHAAGMVSVPVLNHAVRPGDVISDADVLWTDLRQSRTDSGIATTAEQLVGQVARRQIMPDSPINLRDVQPPQLVIKGTLVTMTLTTPYVSVSAQGKALQDGAMGDVIKVMNTQSNRTVEGRIAGPNMVVMSRAVSAPSN